MKGPPQHPRRRGGLEVKKERQTAERLYNQWREAFALVSAFAETLPHEEDDRLSTPSLIYQNAYVIVPKIVGASGGTLYQIKMEYAALIRFNCRQLWAQVGYAVLTGEANDNHKKVIEEALPTFKKDKLEDEWGLF